MTITYPWTVGKDSWVTRQTKARNGSLLQARSEVSYYLSCIAEQGLILGDLQVRKHVAASVLVDLRGRYTGIGRAGLQELDDYLLIVPLLGRPRKTVEELELAPCTGGNVEVRVKGETTVLTREQVLILRDYTKLLLRFYSPRPPYDGS